MDALSERPEMQLLFDTPAGRIVESFADGVITQTQVLDFYRRSLPQLGWRPDPKQETRFIRDTETLEIDFPQTLPHATNETLVRFRIAPSAEK